LYLLRHMGSAGSLRAGAGCRAVWSHEIGHRAR
jgi:hypothetical protein